KETLIMLILGTATPGGGFPLYGDAFAEMINAQEPALRIQTRNTKGSTENVPLLEAGKLDLALVAGEVASAALARPGTPLRIVAAMYSSPGMLIVKGDSPYRSLADLRGKTVVMGTQASGVTQLGRTVLESLSISVTPIFLEKAADGPPMLMDGRADALWGAGVGWPAFAALAKQGGRFIVPSADEIKIILAKNPALQPNTLPAKSYAGQDQPLASVGSWSYVLAHQKLPEQTAYLVARAVHRAEAPFAARLEQARETTMANTVVAAPRRELIHPGVLKYLSEIKH
ncbi:MAG TPA: TAXI family TRAP transporter solute-binding subunit, partial [Burkholderiales bacterium]|nr:TAXI family TRAP transporter solute-binding subunit [Burkholderiales bacterium]